MKEHNSYIWNIAMNTGAGLISAFVVVIINFCLRYTIVKVLGAEYNGLHNLFQSIINVLMVMELGFRSAVIVHLYSPVKKGDYGLANTILYFYRNIYRGLAFVFILVGVVICFFCLDGLVKSNIPMDYVRICFLVFVLVMPCNYLTYYKQTILYADQKSRISLLFLSFWELVIRGTQILMLIFLKSYLLLVVLFVVEKFVCNITCARYIDTKYKWVDVDGVSNVSQSVKTSVINTIKPLMIHQIVMFVQNSLPAILCGLLMDNVAVVGYYGNYQLIYMVLIMIFTQFGSAFTNSFGHLAVEGSIEQKRNAYMSMFFVMCGLGMVCCSGFVVCVQPFIELVFGTEYLLDFGCVLVLAMGLMSSALSNTIVSAQNAVGAHIVDAKYMVLQMLCSVCGGYFLGLHYGVIGILCGTTVSYCFFTCVLKTMLLGHVIAQISYIKSLKHLFAGIMIISFGVCMSYCVTAYLGIGNLFWRCVFHGCVSTLLSILIIAILLFKVRRFNYILLLVKKLFVRK